MKTENKLFKIYAVALFLCVLFSVFLLNGKKAEAADDKDMVMGYQFVLNNKVINSDEVIKMGKVSETLFVKTKDEDMPFPSGTEFRFISTDPGVVACEYSGNSNYTLLKRKGPGETTIQAEIMVPDSKDPSKKVTYAITCQVRVELKLKNDNLDTIDFVGHRALKLGNVGVTEQVRLHYVDYDENFVYADDISVTWETENPMVATVDQYGNVTAVGPGCTDVYVTADVSTGNGIIVASVPVFVAPLGSFTEEAAPYNGYVAKIDPPHVVEGNKFDLYINGPSAGSLYWKVFQVVNGRERELGDTNLLQYIPNKNNGKVEFYGVKAGTYIIRAFTTDNKNYQDNNRIPSFEATVIVKFKLSDLNLLMNVGDTYDIIANSNIPSAEQFNYLSSNPNIASVEKGVITAKNSSSDPVKITLSYNTNSGIFETGTNTAYEDEIVFEITVTVIDGIQLNYSEVTINTKGTILLEPIVTNRNTSVEWKSSDSKIATVENGLVTGIKEGTAVITATQNIRGIIKTAKCIVYVQASVESVTLDPKEITLGIGKYETIQASVKPSSLNGVSLKWVSSNEEIVKITEAGKLSVTVQGVAGGTAVISAINQDNVVVGFCSVTVLQPVEGMTLSETEVTARIGDKVQLRATVTPDNATNQAVTWKSSNPKVATVTDNGLVTMKAAGTASIICTSADNPSVQEFCNVTVLKAVSSVSLDIDSKEMYVGENYRLTYLVSPSDASTPDVIWTSTNTAVVTVDGTGMLTAKGIGQAEIIIKTVDGSYMDLCTIVVKQKPTNVKLSVNNLVMNKGEYFYMDVVLTPANSTKEGLVWECVDTSIATVSSTGRITAKAPGQTIILVKTENGATAYCKLTVLEAVTALEITPGKATMDVGEKLQLYTEFTPATASNTAVYWSSSDEDIATVDKDGEVTAKQGGLVVIQCESDDGGYNAVCIIKVMEEVTEIKITPEQYKLGLGKTFQLKAEITNSTASDKDVEWFSSDESVCTVDKNGKIKGVSLGYATITAMALDGSDVEATCEIRVVTEVTGMTMNYTSITLIQGNTFQLDAAIRPADATYKTPSWKSDDSEIAMVDDDGVVTAISPGTTWITAEARDSSGKYCKCYVTVIAPIPSTGVSTMVDEVVMAPGEKKTVIAKATPANTTDSMIWTSSDESIVRVNPVTGEMTAIAPGNASVIVMMDSGKKAVINVIVVGMSRTSVVMDYYSSGVTLYVEGTTSTIRWYSTNPKVVEVRNGNLTSRGAGTATVEARVNGRTLTCTVRVIAP